MGLAEDKEELVKERIALEQATLAAHQVAQELKQAVQEAREEIRAYAKSQTFKHLAKAYEQAAELIRKAGPK